MQEPQLPTANVPNPTDPSPGTGWGMGWKDRAVAVLVGFALAFLFSYLIYRLTLVVFPPHPL
jgi:hypothetical protein